MGNSKTATIALVCLVLAAGCRRHTNHETPTSAVPGRTTPSETAPALTTVAPMKDLCSDKVAEAYDHFYPSYLRDENMTDEERREFRHFGGLMRLESNYVGGGGNRSDHTVAFCTILDSPQADKIFKNLLSNRDVPLGSRLYALCGVYWTDRKAFTQHLVEFRKSDEEIEWQNGCIVTRHRLKAILPDIESGRYPRALLAFSQQQRYRDTYAAWRNKNVPEEMHLESSRTNRSPSRTWCITRPPTGTAEPRKRSRARSHRR